MNRQRNLKEEVELNEEQLKTVTGGIVSGDEVFAPICCPKCGSYHILRGHKAPAIDLDLCECLDCRHKFFVEK